MSLLLRGIVSILTVPAVRHISTCRQAQVTRLKGILYVFVHMHRVSGWEVAKIGVCEP